MNRTLVARSMAASKRRGPMGYRVVWRAPGWPGPLKQSFRSRTDAEVRFHELLAGSRDLLSTLRLEELDGARWTTRSTLKPPLERRRRALEAQRIA